MVVVLLAGLIACGAPPDDVAADGGADSGVADAGARLSWDEPSACAAPRASVTYEEAGAAWGLTGADDPMRIEGGGLAVDDLDHDGDLDFVFTFEEDGLRVFRQDGGAVVEERLPGVQSGNPSLADFDHDGWNDLLVGGSTGALFRNEEGRLVGADPIGALRGWMREGVPADLDGDGDLDVAALLTSPQSDGDHDQIFWNDGDLVFRRDAEALEPTVARRKSFDGIVFDWDGDGALDLYVVNDMGAEFGPNVLWHNQSGAFVDAGADCACGVTMSGMGGSVADFNGDGFPDLYLAAVSSNVLLAGGADGLFVDVTRATSADPVSEAGMGWGSAWLDHDNDGHPDIVVTQGELGAGLDGDEPVRRPVHLLRQEEGVFRDIAPELGLARNGVWRGVLPVELNGDGVLDLVVHSLDERPQLFLSEGCTDANWLAVEAPIGSVVRVDAGGRSQTAWVTSDQGYGAVRTPQAWFGLGDAAEIDRLEVTLPWGAGTLVAEGPLAARRRVRVMPETR